MSSTNQTFCVLYTKDGKTLVKVPANADLDSFSIQPVVEVIGERAFFAVNTIQQIALPDGVRDCCLLRPSIGAWPWSVCPLPASLEILGDRVFEVCPSLCELRFAGEPPVFELMSAFGLTPTIYVPTVTDVWSAIGLQFGCDIVATAPNTATF
jgi:hypothetical protein